MKLMTTDTSFPSFTVLSEWPADLDRLGMGRYLVHVPVAALLSGQVLTLAIHIVRGGGEGPTLGLLAGIHGDEIPGVRCVREVLTSLSVERLRGAVVAVPIANPLAWQAQQRTTPERDVDRANLARVFGSPARSTALEPAVGSVTQRIAAALERTVYITVTHLIDYHCYGRDTMVRLALYRTGQDRATQETSARMARVFGLGVLRGVEGSQGTTSAYAAGLGIPTCIVEMGGTNVHRRCEDTVVRLGTDGALRIMRDLEMIDTAPPGPQRQLVVDRSLSIAPQVSGYYVPDFDLEDLFRPEYPHGIPVHAGQALGQIFDPYTLEWTETLTAPEDGSLVGLFRGGPFQVGGPSLSLAVGRHE